MSALVLRARTLPRQRVDLSPLTPERLRGKSAADIARIELASGNRRIAVGELFDVGAGDVAELVIGGANGRLDFIGSGMSEGTMTVEGDAGAYLGQGMRDGRVRVTGNAGPWAAAQMSGGAIAIAGDAGDFLGGALPGQMRGMNGGLVTVRGKAGERAGDRMRRGVIVVEGDAGAYVGSRMIAGTVLVLGATVGAYPGLGMKRGTLLLRSAPQRMLPTFADAGTHELGFLRLLAGTLATEIALRHELQTLGARVHKYAGDAAAAGKGEILVWNA